MCFFFFFAFAHYTHPSHQPLKRRGNERFNERNGAIDPPFILMGRRSQSITGLLILLFKRKAERERERGGVKERGCLAGLLRDLPPNLCILG